MKEAGDQRQKKWNQLAWRVAGLFLIVFIIAGSCTGRGCQGCQSCPGCGEPGPTKPGPEAPVAKETPGGCAGPAQPEKTQPSAESARPGSPTPPSRTGVSPFQPARVLDSNTFEYQASAEEKLKAQERLNQILKQGEGQNPPVAPSELTVQPDASGTRAILRWRDLANNEVAYQVDRADTSGVFGVAFILGAGAHEVIDGPLPVGDYSYRVRALGLYGASAYAGPVSVKLTGATSPPTAPSNLTATAGPGLKIILAWNDSADNESYFRIERAEGSGGFISLGLLGPDSASYEDTEVQPEVRYVYRVIAGNPAGDSAPSNLAEAKLKKEEKPPTAPANLRATTVGPAAIALEWEDKSDNEEKFWVEQKILGREQFFSVLELPPNTTKALLSRLTPGQPWTFRLRAENSAGLSEPSNEVTTTAESPALATYIMTINPNGQITIDQPGGLLPRLIVKSSAREGEIITAQIAVQNPAPEFQLENVYAVVEFADALGLALLDCDRGPTSCAVDEGIGANPVGYQYVEGGYIGQALHGGEMEFYPTRDRRFAVRDIWPACGSVSVTWKISGVSTLTTLAVVLYADKAPADFTRDPRMNPELSLFRVEPYTIGLSDGLHEPGARTNPTARPVHSLRTGDVFAVNISVEAGDWLERQAQIGQAQNDPRAFYVYYHFLAFALTYDPQVIRPIANSVVMSWGDILRPGLRDQMLPPYALDDGWSSLKAVFFPFPSEGWMQAIFEYPVPFALDNDETGKKICLHCGQEGFVTPAGIPQGPDPEPEANLGLIYFEVIGPPGSGTALRLAPKPETYIQLMNTSGTLSVFVDDVPLDDRRELNELLPPTFQLPGDYQVQESYLCVE